MASRNFKVLEMVGRGSFASVYKVVRKADSRVYAMKRVKIGKMSRKEITDALNEVRFLSSVRHSNIVGFFEAFVENDSELCIVMEYCGCGDLAQKVERYKRKRQYIHEAKIWGYLIQALRALQILHGNGVCHRDLKTANTFLAEDGSIKIGDMNVSKQMKAGQLMTQIGTPYYMAPEIWNNKAYDERCDIWSLGCMIYEVAALRPPFLGDSFASLKRAVVAGRYAQLPRVYSESLMRVVSLMLRVNGRERPTASQLLAMPEVAPKAEIMDAHHGAPMGDVNAALMATIRLPQSMKKLNDVLPKPCYPDTQSAPRPSGREYSQASLNPASAPPAPPLPPSDREAREAREVSHHGREHESRSVPPSVPSRQPVPDRQLQQKHRRGLAQMEKVPHSTESDARSHHGNYHLQNHNNPHTSVADSVAPHPPPPRASNGAPRRPAGNPSARYHMNRAW